MRSVSAFLMVGSALALGVLGMICLFFPDEVAPAVGVAGEAAITIQVVAGGLLALAILNWMGRTAIYGGIYGRPIVMANLTMGTVSGLSAIRVAGSSEGSSSMWLLAVLFLTQAAAFGTLMWFGPWEKRP